jgi:hypothetical protein
MGLHVHLVVVAAAAAMLSPSCKAGRALSFSEPARVYPRGNTTAKTFGAVYADAFYSLAKHTMAAQQRAKAVSAGSKTVLFGVPGVPPTPHGNTSYVVSVDGGSSWSTWFGPAEYVSNRTGYPFTAVHDPSGEATLHDLGSACASSKGVPQTVFSNIAGGSTVGSWSAAGRLPSHSVMAAAVSFKSLPVPLTCTTGGVGADCFWLHAGGTVELPKSLGGGMLLSNCVAWLGGRFGATANGSGVFVWHSTTGLEWTFRSTIITAAQVPSSGEGPNENDITLLADGKTLMSVMRIDDGVDGGKVAAKNYRSATSTDGGMTWTTPHAMFDVDGRVSWIRPYF